MSKLEELHIEMFGDGKPKPTDLICPITGSTLMDDGCERHVMDPDHFYFAQNDSSIRYARHPFSYNLFRQVESGTRNTGAKEIRFFRLNEDKSWTEMMRLPGFSILIPLDTTPEEVDKLVKEKIAEEKERKRMYDEGVANGTIVPISINLKPVTSNTISMEKVEVKPMSSPSSLQYLDYKYDNKDEQCH